MADDDAEKEKSTGPLQTFTKEELEGRASGVHIEPVEVPEGIYPSEASEGQFAEEIERVRRNLGAFQKVGTISPDIDPEKIDQPSTSPKKTFTPAPGEIPPIKVPIEEGMTVWRETKETLQQAARTGKFENFEVVDQRTENGRLILELKDPKSEEDRGRILLTERVGPTPAELGKIFDEAVRTGIWEEDYDVVDQTGEKGTRELQVQNRETGKRFRVRESNEPATNILREIPLGKNWTEFEAWVKDRIRRAEQNNEFTQEFISRFRDAMNDYEVAGGLPLIPAGQPNADQPDADALNRLTRYMEIRGTLSLVSYSIGLYDYKEINALVSRYVWDGLVGWKRMSELWAEEFGTGQPVVRLISEFIETSTASAMDYWYQNESDRKARVRTFLGTLGLLDGAVNDARFDEVWGVTENLFHMTGMSSHYTGPVTAPTGGRLVEEEIMDEVDAVAPVISGAPPWMSADPDGNPDMKYIRNELYYQKWIERRQAGVKYPEPAGRPLGDPSGGLRRVFYTSGELDRLDNTKAKSLRYAAETFVRALPVMNGDRTLKDFMNAPDSRPAGGGHFKAWYAFRYGIHVENGGEAIGAFTNLMNEPIKGDEQAGDPQQLGDQLKNVTDILVSFNKYLKLGVAPNILYFGAARLLESAFKYVNGNSPDRKAEFPKWRRFPPELLNVIVRNPGLSPFISEGKREETLKGLNSTDERIFRRHTARASSRWLLHWFWEFLKIIGITGK